MRRGFTIAGLWLVALVSACSAPASNDPIRAAPVVVASQKPTVLGAIDGAYDSATGTFSVVVRRPDTGNPEALPQGQSPGDVSLYVQGTSAEGFPAATYDFGTHSMSVSVDAENGSGGTVSGFTANITSITPPTVGMVGAPVTAAVCAGGLSLGGTATTAPCAIPYGNVAPNAAFPVPVLTAGQTWTFFDGDNDDGSFTFTGVVTSLLPTYAAASLVTGGRINVEISFTASSDSIAYAAPVYAWSIAAGLDLYFTPSTGVWTFEANGDSYSFHSSAAGWRAGALVDVWFAGGGGAPMTMQYRSTYVPNPNGYAESGVPILMNNYAVLSAADIVPGAGPLYPAAYIDGTGSIGAVRGVNLDMDNGQPSWALPLPLTSAPVTRNWVVVGDSLETGYLSGVAGFPSYTAKFLGDAWSFSNEGIAGEQTATMLGSLGSQVYANLTPNLRNVVTLAGGINDLLAGTTADEIWGMFEDWSTCVRAYCAGQFSAWNGPGTVYAPGALASVGGTLYQTIGGGTSGATAPTGSVVDATISDGGVTWFVTGPVSQNTGSPFADVKLGSTTPPIVWGSDAYMQPDLTALSRSIVLGYGAGQPFDFLLMDLNASDVMNYDAEVPWRISDLLHPSADAIFRQGALCVSSLRGL